MVVLVVAVGDDDLVGVTEGDVGLPDGLVGEDDGMVGVPDGDVDEDDELG